MKTEELKHLPIMHYENHTLESELTVGNIIEIAEISTEDNAWIKGFENGKFSFNVGVSQHGPNHQRQFPAYVYGIIEDGTNFFLAYTLSRKPHANKTRIVRLTDLKEIIDYYRLI